MHKGLKTFLKVVGSIVVISLVYLAGYSVGHKNLVFEKGFVPKVVNLDFGKPKDVDFTIFWDAWDIAKKMYIGETDSEKMVYGAISGMLQSLGDPYTVFLSPEEAKRFNEDMSGQFDGIGAELESRDGYIIVVAPLGGSPAEQAGIRAKDIILKIDDQDVSELGFTEAISKIRGKKGTEVRLNVLHDGSKEPEDISIRRDTIVVKSVKYEIKDNIGYIKINQFGDDTVKLTKEAVDKALSSNVSGIIIDLRNNPGGYLQDSVDIASLFLETNKPVVIERKKEGTETVYKTSLNTKTLEKPLVVLVNGGSASASEIFAGAIQDYSRGKIIGEKTFGKGSVQTLENLVDESQIKITIAEWLTPNRRQINKKGIDPDIVVELTKEDADADRDPQFDKAMEELKK